MTGFWVQGSNSLQCSEPISFPLSLMFQRQEHSVPSGRKQRAEQIVPAVGYSLRRFHLGASGTSWSQPSRELSLNGTCTGHPPPNGRMGEPRSLAGFMHLKGDIQALLVKGWEAYRGICYPFLLVIFQARAGLSSPRFKFKFKKSYINSGLNFTWLKWQFIGGGWKWDLQHLGGFRKSSRMQRKNSNVWYVFFIHTYLG